MVIVFFPSLLSPLSLSLFFFFYSRSPLAAVPLVEFLFPLERAQGVALPRRHYTA